MEAKKAIKPRKRTAQSEKKLSKYKQEIEALEEKYERKSCRDRESENGNKTTTT